MNRDKQIEEMAKAINVADHEYCNGKCIGCEHKPMRIEDCACVDMAIAKGLVNAGYRKSTEVAREIFEEIERMLTVEIINIEEDFFHGTAARWDATRKKCYEEILVELDELKKKYTEEVK